MRMSRACGSSQSEDVDDLGNAILELYRNPQLRQQLAANAAQHVRMNNWDVKKHDYLQLVDMLVDAAKSSRQRKAAA